VLLTPEGKRQFRTMARAHEEWVVQLFAGLDARQQAALFELLGRLKETLPQQA
jgi:DNA-binding MarR family transcriptional regulator